MTYPGTKPRVPSAIESSLISRVTELERERDELVAVLCSVVSLEQCIGRSFSMMPQVQIAKDVLAKHTRPSAGS